jgi:ribose-phosphate pyrophosphokinase
VQVLDPHSSVSEALINNIMVCNPKKYIEKTLGRIESQYNCEHVLAFYPDEGAMKRYSGLLDRPYAFGIKKRDWATGKIEGLDVAGSIDKIKDSRILIIDDICSKGGTFYHSAKKLKELGAKEIYLYVTHCENTILEGELLTSGLIEKVYTTNSIFTKEHEKIKVFEL